MTFTDMLRRRVFVDGQSVEAAEAATAADLIRAVGQNPNRRDLVLSNPDGSTDIISSRKRIKLRDGERFETQLNGTGGF
jgi:sulfur carrier protein ThiS